MFAQNVEADSNTCSVTAQTPPGKHELIRPDSESVSCYGARNTQSSMQSMHMQHTDPTGPIATWTGWNILVHWSLMYCSKWSTAMSPPGDRYTGILAGCLGVETSRVLSPLHCLCFLWKAQRLWPVRQNQLEAGLYITLYDFIFVYCWIVC